MKTCTLCGLTKETHQFNRRERADGSFNYKAFCKACQSARERSKHQKLPRVAYRTSSATAPDYVIADRDRRLAEYRTPGQIMLGDPPPSQSALAKRI